MPSKNKQKQVLNQLNFLSLFFFSPLDKNSRGRSKEHFTSSSSSPALKIHPKSCHPQQSSPIVPSILQYCTCTEGKYFRTVKDKCKMSRAPKSCLCKIVRSWVKCWLWTLAVYVNLLYVASWHTFYQVNFFGINVVRCMKQGVILGNIGYHRGNRTTLLSKKFSLFLF